MFNEMRYLTSSTFPELQAICKIDQELFNLMKYHENKINKNEIKKKNFILKYYSKVKNLNSFQF